ncbi:MAG: hypothetical protein KA765_01430 [Thermoflexales bacterium]|nr:hypothetical protein [Thermoflexales bacterium]
MIISPPDHQLFKQYPLNGRVALSTGEAPTPYHIYDGYGLFIGGVADLPAVQRLLAPEGVLPVTTTDGHALMGIWICDFTEASLGAHTELQFALAVTRSASDPIEPHPLNILTLMLTRPDLGLLCHGLWNDTPNVVAYNREYLSLNARQTDSRITRSANALTFNYTDHATGQPILSGAVQLPQQASWRASWSLAARLGFKSTMALRQQPWISMSVLNPVGVVLNRNGTSRTFTHNTTTVLRYFDRRADRLEFGDTPYRALNFMPQLVQYMDGFKFVYLQPE